MDIVPAISRRRQERLRKVQDLFDSGMKVREIATYFGISERMVFNDLEDSKIIVQQHQTIMALEVSLLHHQAIAQLAATFFSDNPTTESLLSLDIKLRSLGYLQ